MSAVTSIAIASNSFEGVLPESGLQALRTMTDLFANKNRFAGTLPKRVVTGLEFLFVSDNDFE
eukprot:5663064-Amphidinium_carterae.1